MKVAAVQMVSGMSLEQNLRDAIEMIAQAAELGCELVALPEYFCLLGAKDTDKLAIAEHAGQGLMQDKLSHCARERGVWLVAGTLPIKTTTPDRVFNACLVFDPQGKLAARYDKMHLFAFTRGQEHYDESRVLVAGSEPVTFEMQDKRGQHWRIGLSVCYDLRFPELYRRLCADVLLVPSAFTHTTGQAHWEVLLRSRAIENLAYVIAPAQGGLHVNGRRTWGRSMIVDSWGQILAQRSEGAGLVIAELDWMQLQTHRKQLPALQHRRL